MKINLNQITSELGKNYKSWKQAEKSKNKAKDQFFAAVTQELEQDTPAQIIQTIKAKSDYEARDVAAKKYPTYIVLTLDEPEEGIFKVTLEEDVTMRPFIYVNAEDGMVYQRQVVEGSSLLDDDRLREENPRLWEEITHIPNELVMKPLEDLSDSQLESLREFMYSGRPVVKLAAPRKAKPEELEADD